MTTVTIELPDEAARIAADKARQANMTLSEWIGLRIAGGRPTRRKDERDALGYPKGWFQYTGGSLADVEDFGEPVDPPVKSVPSLEL